MQSRGPGRLDHLAGSAPIPAAQARWSDDSWTVTFVHALDEEGGELVPGSALHIAVAIWNGATGDHGGRKSVSIWQSLELED